MPNQMQPEAVADLPWTNSAPSPQATCTAILLAMKDLHEHASDTVWLTPHETVFDRLVTLYSIAGGDYAELVKRWPQYFS